MDLPGLDIKRIGRYSVAQMSHHQNLIVETCVAKIPVHFTARFVGITGLHETISSPEVSAEGFKWKLTLVPIAYNNDFNCQVSVESPNNVAVKATCSITLVNQRQGLNLRCASQGKPEVRRHNHGSIIIYENSNFLKSSHLASSGQFCVNDTIIFDVDITLFTNQQTRNIISKQPSGVSYTSSSTTILNDLKSFAFSETMADVRIITNANQNLESKKNKKRKRGKTEEIEESFRSFPAHSFILGLRSSVFRAMLECPMRESETRQIAMHDVREDVMECFLSYLYTDELPSLWDQKYSTVQEADETIETLLELSCKYDVPGLKVLCEKDLEPQINCTNVLRLLMLADKCGANHLKIAALNFISDNANIVFKDIRKLHALSKELAFVVIQAMSGNNFEDAHHEEDANGEDTVDY